MIERPSPWLLAPIGTSLLLLAIGLHDVVLTPLCLLAILSSYAHRGALDPPARPAFVVLAAALLWLGCLAYYSTVLGAGAGLQPIARVVPGSHHLIASGGLSLAVLAALQWHTRRPAGARSGPILTTSGLIAVASGDHHGLGLEYLAALGMFVAATTVAAALTSVPAARGPRRRELAVRALYSLILVVGVGGGTWAVGRTLRAVERGLFNIRLEGLALPDYRGLGAGGGMLLRRSGRFQPSDRLLATIDGDDPPGLLRTQVMDTYHDGHWKTPRDLGEPLDPVRTADGRSRFDLPGGPPEAFALSRAVTLLVNLGGAVPLPYGARRVLTGDAVSFNLAPGSVLDCREPADLGGYELVETADGGVRDQAGLALVAPEAVLARLRPLAAQVAGDGRTDPLAAARRVERYFHDHYTYSLDVELAPGEDPIVDFVLNRRPAYCEHYASGMALMLWSLDIPARVAGGFSVEEWNDLAGAWSIRQRDAHAWTEVYDPAAGRWVAFDATPPWVTAPRHDSGWRARLTRLGDLARLAMRALVDGWLRLRLVERLVDGGAAAWRALGSRPVLGAALLAAAAILLVYLRRALEGLAVRVWRRRVVDRRAGPREAATRCFERVALALERGGHPIGRSETADAYLRRRGDDPHLRALVALYAELRFGPAAGDAGHLAELQRLTREVERVAR